MNPLKVLKDRLIKSLLGKESVPRSLLEFKEYFIVNRVIHFQYTKKNNLIIAKSKDFKWGTIITSGRNMKEVDTNIKDAILTSFEIPSSYAQEANIHKEGVKAESYALA